MDKLEEIILNVQEKLEKNGEDIRLLQSHRREIAQAVRDSIEVDEKAIYDILSDVHFKWKEDANWNRPQSENIWIDEAKALATNPKEWIK